ncbi:ADP-ribose glycohydrolase MACROD2-like [Rhopilema esculentum]|uniref:ADP-ribose glycohydrolase MACROD2-like n=1 Tax=Rhopilema esculentum TaxID=499914 RepID=UPI0031CE9CF8
MKRSLTMDERESRATSKKPNIPRTKSEPPLKGSDRVKSREEFYGDPDNEEYGKMYLEMPINEKRKLYRCGKNFEKADELVVWPAIWQVRKEHFRFKGKIPASQVVYPVNKSFNNKIAIKQGDITTLEIDAIVNAANSSLLGGGGVDGAIHRAAGSSLRNECIPLKGCNTGDAKITSGHRLPARYIIHTVGPVGKQPVFLERCYQNCLDMALKFNIRTIAFPCISTGVYGYPSTDAAHVALNTVRKWLEVDDNADKVDKVIFCIFLNSDWNIYGEYLQFYFPCEEILQEEERNKSKADTNKESARKDKEGTDDLGDVPDADLDDLLAMVQEENKDRTQKDDEASKQVEAGNEKREKDKGAGLKKEEKRQETRSSREDHGDKTVRKDEGKETLGSGVDKEDEMEQRILVVEKKEDEQSKDVDNVNMNKDVENLKLEETRAENGGKDQ